MLFLLPMSVAAGARWGRGPGSQGTQHSEKGAAVRADCRLDASLAVMGRVGVGRVPSAEGMACAKTRSDKGSRLVRKHLATLTQVAAVQTEGQ